MSDLESRSERSSTGDSGSRMESADREKLGILGDRDGQQAYPMFADTVAIVLVDLKYGVPYETVRSRHFYHLPPLWGRLLADLFQLRDQARSALCEALPKISHAHGKCPKGIGFRNSRAYPRAKFECRCGADRASEAVRRALQTLEGKRKPG